MAVLAPTFTRLGGGEKEEEEEQDEQEEKEEEEKTIADAVYLFCLDAYDNRVTVGNNIIHSNYTVQDNVQIIQNMLLELQVIQNICCWN